MESTFKHHVHATTLQHLLDKIETLNLELKELSGEGEEIKSSVGDRHETVRAMMQLEQEKIYKILDEAYMQKMVLDKIHPVEKAETISLGSLVHTNHGYVYISTGLGKIKVDDEYIMVISPKSPLGAKMMGLKNSSAFTINNMEYKILSIE